jgi:hypothetical protein
MLRHLGHLEPWGLQAPWLQQNIWLGAIARYTRDYIRWRAKLLSYVAIYIQAGCLSNNRADRIRVPKVAPEFCGWHLNVVQAVLGEKPEIPSRSCPKGVQPVTDITCSCYEIVKISGVLAL